MAETTLPATIDQGGLPAMTGGQRDWRDMLPAPLAEFVRQPALSRALPAIAGIGAIGIAGALYLALSQGPSRVLYTSLTDGERAKVVEALDAGGIGYTIDNSTGALAVAEDDVYRARMLVASDAGIAAPEGASEMLDAIPMGTSRTLEGERLRLARERELMLTIREIDGIESVRVHLATPERSVFVRENSQPSASVMVRLVSGRSLSQGQVEAIVNLVSASVPGMTADSVRVVDQNGRLLSSPREEAMDGLVRQREFETKLRDQIDALLLPLLGEGNYSSQVQVELDQKDITTARETYEKEGVVRNESERNATRTGANAPGGIPGVAANTPPPDAELVDGPPDPAAAAAEGAPTDTETAVQRSYELGREVAVTNTSAGGLVRLSVAVAVSQEALKAAAPLTAAQIEQLVGAAVGINAQRGDQVEVVAGVFESTEIEQLAFYETQWFGMLVRYGAALVAVLLVLLFAVRPLLGGGRGKKGAKKKKGKAGDETLESEAGEGADRDADGAALATGQFGQPPAPEFEGAPFGDLPRQVELARRLAVSQPERAVEALQRMLEAPDRMGGEAPAR